MADLQVGPLVENPNNRKHATHEGVSEKQESLYNKMKESSNKVENLTTTSKCILLEKVTEVENN